MRTKKIIAILFAFVIFTSLTGCQKIKPDTPEDGKYSTQTPMSALEYSIFMNKQITVFTNQLSTRMTIAQNLSESEYENEVTLAEHSADIMQKALDEVVVTLPSEGKDKDRELLIKTMKTSIQNVRNYANDLKKGKSVNGYIKNFQNDFNELTGFANLYYE